MNTDVQVQLEVCRAAIEARDFMCDDGQHEAKIMRVENTFPASFTATIDSPSTTTYNDVKPSTSQVRVYI